MNIAVDRQIQLSISWVKPELDKAIQEVKNSLEEYGKDLNNFEPLLPTLEQLKLMRGTFHILEFYGAALLIEDMEKGVRALLARLAKKPEDAYEALVQAVMTLSGYLDRLNQSPNDVPVILLPIINDLRAARDEPLLTESSLFLPNLSIIPRLPDDVLLDDAKKKSLTETAEALRPYFHAALLTWYRNPKDILSLQQIKLVVRNLESSAMTPRLRQLWWIAGGLIEALIEKGLRTNVSIRLLLGQLDRYIKTVATGNFEDIEKQPPLDLLKNLLFYSAHAVSKGERITTLKKAYNLDKTTLNETDIIGLRENIRAPKSETFTSIAKELNKSLASIKTVIDSYVRGQNRSILSGRRKSQQSLDTVLQPLKHISDTLSLMSLGRERQALNQQIAQFEERINSDSVTRSDLMALASAILHIEAIINNIGNERRIENTNGDFKERRRRRDQMETNMDDVNGTPMNRIPDTEYRLMIQTAAEQAKNNIKEVKNEIMAFLANNNKRKSLDNIPRILNEVRGSLIIISHPFAADLTQALINFTQDKILDTNEVPEANVLDHFAEAVVGLEYFLEAVADGRSQMHTVLAITRENLAAIGYPVQEPASQKKPSPTLESVVTHISDAKALKESAADKRPLFIPVDIDQPDDEVAEIFAEEANEEIEVMGKQLNTLKADITDASALASIRHVFHTLKGSGRIAGATDISEFAAAIEEYLTRVNVGAIQFEERGLKLLIDAYEVLNLLLSAFQSRSPAPLRANSVIQEIMSLTDILVEVPEEEIDYSDSLTQANMPLVEQTSTETPEPQQEIPTLEPLDGIDDNLLHLAETLQSHINYYIQSNDTDPRSVPLLETIEEINSLIQDNDESSEFAQTTALLSRYIGNIVKNGGVVSLETLDILQEYCATTLDLLVEPGMEQQPVSNEAEAMEEFEIEEPVAGISNVIPDEETSTEEQPPAGEYDEEISLIDIFVEEAQDLVRQSNDILAQWASGPADDDQLNALKRALHTLKGSARMAGISAIGHLAHAAETLLEKVTNQEEEISLDFIGVMHDVLDATNDIVTALENEEEIAVPVDLIEEVQRYCEEKVTAEPALEIPEEIVEEEQVVKDTTPATEEIPTEASVTKTTEVLQPEKTPQDSVQKGSEPIRLSSETIDKLVDNANTEGSLITDSKRNIAKIQNTLAEMDASINRLQAQLRDIEFGGHRNIETSSNTNDVDISRFTEEQQLAQRLMENVGDIENLHSNLTRLTIETEGLIHQQSKLHGEIQDDLVQSRMTAFVDQGQRMQRIVRQACRELGKKVNLVQDGFEGAIDRSLLDHLMGPFEHLLRNAIAHGIETPEQRTALGKSEQGTIDFTFDKDGSELIFTLSDDGAGIDLQAVRNKAISKGLIQEDDTLSDDQLIQFIFAPGFSTSEEISQLSGRGIGMDVVSNEIQNLGGEILVHTDPGHGTTFIIRVPYSATLNKTLLVRCGNTIYAFPHNMVEATRPIDRETLISSYSKDKPVLEIEDTEYPLWYLGTLLNNEKILLPNHNKVAYTILLRSNRLRLAIQVDEIIDTKETMVKPTGPQLGKVNGIAGATILSDGEVALIADVAALIRLATTKIHQPLKLDTISEEQVQVPNIMVVDDSITVRKVSERFLKRNGYVPILAKDGIDALEILEHSRPSLFLLDIEMPRMDGLELTKRIRQHPAHSKTPIIMITSRTSKIHKQAADEAGVDIFLGKPYQENQLLSYIKNLLDEE